MKFEDKHWFEQAKQYHQTGKGIEYFRGELSDGDYVDCLLKYDDYGNLVGILNHYPKDKVISPIAYEKAGNILIQVHPKKRGRRIASALLDECRKRYTIDFKQQILTDDGLLFLKKYTSKRGLIL